MPEDVSLLKVALRWLHLTGAMIVIGGIVFARYALSPAARALPSESRPAFDQALRRRFTRLFMLAALALLASGLYNYVGNEMPVHKGQAPYHALMGLKIIFALVVFFIGGTVFGRSAAFQGFRTKSNMWLSATVVLSMVVVVIAAYLRAIPDATVVVP